MISRIDCSPIPPFYAAVTRRRPADALAFADLVDPAGGAAAIEAITANGAISRQRAGRLVLHALAPALARLVAAPFLFDGVLVAPNPARSGIEVPRDGGTATAWVELATVADAGTAAECGAILGHLAGPMLDTVSEVAHLGRHAATHLLADGLDQAVRLFTAAGGGRVSWSTTGAVLDAVGLEPPGRTRRLVVSLDDGRTYPALCRRTCCAGSDPVDYPCPTCPRFRSDEARVAATRAWLATVDPDTLDALCAIGIAEAADA